MRSTLVTSLRTSTQVAFVLGAAALAAARPADDPVADGGAAELPAIPIAIERASQGAWRDHILPGEGQLRWEEIGWIPTFAGGVRAAEARQRPLLLWVMNGHPLGCT